MAQRRKYRFNWIDHLHYMGRSSWRVHTRWPKPLDAVTMSVLWFPLCLLIVYRSARLEAAMFFIACLIVVAFGSEWLLGKYRFTPECERVYFRRYPQRKHYSVKVLFWIPVVIYLLTMSIACLIAYNMAK